MQDENLAELWLGTDAEQFVKSELGQTVIGLARQDAEEAKQRLAEISPWRRRAISKLQSEVWRAQSFEAYLVTLIERGRQARHLLDNQE